VNGKYWGLTFSVRYETQLGIAELVGLIETDLVSCSTRWERCKRWCCKS